MWIGYHKPVIKPINYLVKRAGNMPLEQEKKPIIGGVKESVKTTLTVGGVVASGQM
ncbi:MAG: hypothetical protein ACJASB_003866 [Shewanella psychromarinicola]|jgi:hypothetical protein